MYRNDPKLIFRIELFEFNCVRIHLILLNSYFLKSKKVSFFSDDFFLITNAGFFSLFKSKILCLPNDFKKCNKSISLKFDNEKERRNYLMLLNRALIEWSQSYYWEGFNDSNKCKIIYNNKLWILF